MSQPQILPPTPSWKKCVVGNVRAIANKIPKRNLFETRETVILDTILTTLLDLIKTPSIQVGFNKTEIVEYIHYLLLAFPSECITRKCFKKLIELSEMFSDPCCQALFDSIFFDYRIWCGCKKNIQMCVVGQITYLKERIDLFKMVMSIELFLQPTAVPKTIDFIVPRRKLKRNDSTEIHLNTISALLQIASSKISLESVNAFSHYLYMIRDDDFIRDTLDVLVIHLHTYRKEYLPYSEAIINSCVDIQSIVPSKQQYKVLSIILLFLENVLQTNSSFDCNMITLLVLNCVFVSKCYDSNLYFLLVAQPIKIQSVLDVARINFFAMRYADEEIKEQICTALYDNTVHNNFPKIAFDLLESPIVIMHTIQLTKKEGNRNKFYDLLKIFTIKKMTYFNQKASDKIEQFIDLMINSAFYFTEEMIIDGDSDAFKLVLFVFEHLDVQIRPKLSKLKDKSNKDKVIITNYYQIFLINIYYMLQKFKSYLGQTNFSMSKNVIEETKTCLSLILVLVKELMKIPNCLSLVIENGKRIEIEMIELLLASVLMIVNLIDDEGDVKNYIPIIIKYAKDEKYAPCISVDFFDSLLLISDNEKLLILIMKIANELNQDFQMSLYSTVNHVTQLMNVNDDDATVFVSLINGTLSTTQEINFLKNGQLLKRLRDVIAIQEGGIDSYQIQQETSILILTDKMKKFIKVVGGLNSIVVKEFDKQLNKIQPIIENYKQLSKKIIDELNEDLAMRRKKWRRFVEGTDEFKAEMNEKHWKLKNNISKEGFKMLWDVNEKFDNHQNANTYSAERSQLEDEVNEECNSKSKRKLLNVIFENSKECEWVNLKAFEVNKKFQGRITIPGRIEIGEKELIFTDNPSANNIERKRTKEKNYIFPLIDVKEIILKRYFTEFNGIEIYFKNKSEYFIFPNESIAKKIYSRLLTICNLPDESIEIKIQKLSDKWSDGKISNFEYLFKLNQYSGRSYNDLSHYPIFPWVIQDYTSNILDLSNPKIYRPLELPIPCINQKRHAEEMKRFNELFGEDGAIKDQTAYMYPTFYSACDYVFHFLVRIEPFTTMFIKMNENHYDRPERMFYSIQHTWDICMNSSQCNIELIPEFFCLPDFLMNENEFEFGVNPSTNSIVTDVILPPWAKNAHEFVNLNRLALESPFVSANLNNWIDLIFGYKSCGEEARKAENLYHPSCYVENYNGGEDEELLKKRAMFSGQLPVQLFTKPHPVRKFSVPLMRDLCTKRCTYKKITIQESPCVSSCLDDKGVVLITKNTIYRVPYSLEFSHKKGVIKNKAFEQKIISRNKKFVVTKSSGVILIQSELKQFSLKSNEVTSFDLFDHQGNDYLVFGCSDSLVGVVCLTQPQETPIYLNAHAGKITTIVFDDNSNTLLTGDENGLISCYYIEDWKHLWHVKIGNETLNPILSILANEQYIYVSTPSILYCLSFKGKVVSTLEFFASNLVHSFIPGTIAALTSNNVLCFITTSSLSCLPIDVNMPDLEKEVIISLHYYSNGIFIVLGNGDLLRVSMPLFDF